MSTSSFVGRALPVAVLLALIGCGKSSSSEAPAVPLVGRRALLDARPTLSAKFVGGTALAVLTLDEGAAVRSTRLADLDALTLRTVWPRPAQVFGSAAGGKATLVGGPDLQRQLPAEVLQLDLSTGAVQAVSPPPVQASGFGAPVGGFLLYATAEGRLALLGPGAATATLLPAGDCPVTSVRGTTAATTRHPGWYLVEVTESCPFASQAVVKSRLIHPAKALATIEATDFYEGPTSLLLVSESAFQSGLWRVNADTGAADLLPGTAGARRINFARTSSDDGRFVYTQTGTALAELDLVAETARTFPSTSEPVPVNTLVAVPATVTPATGRLVGLVADSAVVRFDLNKVTPFCGQTSSGGRLARATDLADAPFGVLCTQGATLSAYEWATDSVTVLTTNASGALSPEANHVVFFEAGASRIARIGGGGPAVTPCPGGSWQRIAVSPDGSAAAFSCTGADAVIADLATGGLQAALVAPAGSTLSVKRLAVSTRGRLAAISYSLAGGAGAPIACAADTCTWVFDRVTGQGAQAPVPEALASLSRTAIPATPDETAFTLPTARSSSLVVSTTAGAPRIAELPGDFAPRLRAGDVLIAGNNRIDLAAGNLRFHAELSGILTKIGASTDYLVGRSIYHLAADTFEPLPGDPLVLCGGQPGLIWLDSFSVFPTPLRRYVPGSGAQRVSPAVLTIEPFGCGGGRAYFDIGPDGSSRLVRYDAATGAVTELASDVFSGGPFQPGGLVQAGGLEFLLQKPDDFSGDLSLFDEASRTLRPLGVRARFGPALVVSSDRVLLVGGRDPAVPQVYAARLDGTGAVLLGPGSGPYHSPDGSRVLWNDGAFLHLQTDQGAGSVFDSGGQVLATDESAAHVLYQVQLGKPPLGTWGFALK